MKRREFLSRSLAGIGGLIVGGRLLGTLPEAADYDPYGTVSLGETGITASRVASGTGMRGYQRSSNQTRMGAEKFHRLIRQSYERGIRMFDMADLYGSHPYLKPALDGIPREDYVVTSKIWFRQGGLPEEERPDADVVVNRFLKELQTDYIDIVHMHCVVSPTWNEELRKQMDILEELKEREVIRAHGVSVHTLPALEVAAEEPWVDVVNTRINAFGVKMDDTPEKVAPVLKKMHQNGKGIVVMKLIGEGQFRDDPEKRKRSVEYALNLGVVDVMAVGFEAIEEVDDFARIVGQVGRA